MAKLMLFFFCIGWGLHAVAEKIGETPEGSTRCSGNAFDNDNQQPGQPSIAHIVSGNETLFSISKKYGVAVDDIKRWNNLKNNSIAVGQTLTIHKAPTTTAVSTKENAAEQLSPPPPKSLNTKHTVAPKETLFSIAKQYGVTVDNLKEWNNIGPEGLKAGSAIYIMAPINAMPDKTVSAEQPVLRGKETKENAQNVGKEKTNEVKEATDKSTTNAAPSDKNDSDEIKENGDVALMEGADKTKYLCWHKDALIGSILKVKNAANGKEVFVRVQGHLEAGDAPYILKISSLAAQRLGEGAASFKATVSYYK